MKRFIALLLAVISIAALCSCAKKEPTGVDAIVDYYAVRYSMKEFTEDSIKYVGEDKETGRKEYAVKNEDLDIDVTLFTEEWGTAINVYNEEGQKVHIFSSNVEEN